MSTVAYADHTKALAKDLCTIYRSAVCSGIVGDLAHRKRGGYHISRADQPNSNYSVTRTDDRYGPSDGASAIDITMSTGDLTLMTKRFIAVWNDLSDPRRKYVNAFNGWQGNGDASRWDVVARTRKFATKDHKWHFHLEIRRRYIGSAVARRAIVSIARGQSKAQYLTSIGKAATAAAAAAERKTPVKVPPYPGRVLRRNDRAVKPDPGVRAFQLRMRERGWTGIGVADGLPGAKFEATVRRWQAHCRLPVDGEVGPKTWPTPWTKPLGG